jgi:hypothetical protein
MQPGIWGRILGSRLLRSLEQRQGESENVGEFRPLLKLWTRRPFRSEAQWDARRSDTVTVTRRAAARLCGRGGFLNLNSIIEPSDAVVKWNLTRLTVMAR